MLRIGLIGAGWVTQHHLAGWQRQFPRAKVVAIADPSVERAEHRAKEFDISKVYSDAASLIQGGGIDAVDIAAPREFHADLVRLFAEHQLPIICQKPLAASYAEAVSLVADVTHQTRLMVHENWRFRAYYRQIRKWLDEGRAGEVCQVQMTLMTSGLIEDGEGNLPALVRQPFLANLDRALVMEVLIHHIDALRFLLGDLQIMHSRIGKGCQKILGEDRASITFETASQGVVHLVANFCAHGEPAIQADQLIIIGSKGTIRLQGAMLTCDGESGGSQQYDLASCYVDSYAAAINHFVDSLAAGTPFETSPEDNLQTLALVEEIYARG